MKAITATEWRANAQRCAEFETLLDHPLMQQAIEILREMATPVLSPELLLHKPVQGDSDRDNSARYHAKGGIAYAIQVLRTLSKPSAAQEQKPLPAEWMPEISEPKT